TNKLVLGNEFIEFQARFSGVAEEVWVPVGAVSAIYARETGAGMGFEVQPYEAASPDEEGADTPANSAGDALDETTAAVADTGESDDGDDDGPKRPRLTIVK